MKRVALGRFALTFTIAAFLGGCGTSQPPTSAPGANNMLRSNEPSSILRDVTLTMPHYVPASIVADRRASWMMPEAKKSSALIYAGVWATNDVYVLDYSTGKKVGTLTGFSEPYGQCVDAKGDVYIANFGAGNVVEYARGAMKVLNTYSTGGEPIGCSVNAKGDVAVTSFSPGEIVVFAGGNPSKSTTYTGSCSYQWGMGYDDKGNLVGVGEESTGNIVACALLSGSKSMTTLVGCCIGPITIDYPGVTMWDGKHIGLGDQEAGGTFLLGVWPSTLSGTTLSSSGEVRLTECFSQYSSDGNLFILGKKNTPVNKKEAKVVAGPGLSCSGSGVTLWHYPGGTAFRNIKVSEGTVYGVSVSLSP
ncbi:MAG TPA: hypothetical protein VGI19_00365 [Candidatus Cybelea sp.]|jgi:hypothetical protein